MQEYNFVTSNIQLWPFLLTSLKLSASTCVEFTHLGAFEIVYYDDFPSLVSTGDSHVYY